jgi:uncharacterized protein YceH (UPF0502 family)
MEKYLSPEAIRVLGVLIEKELSTPDYYPMTLNGLTNGCNQKSNRNPVVEFGELQVREILDELQRHRLVGHASVAGGRSEKFRHAAAQHWELDKESLAIMASLMLRGPQTVGELRTHTSRMAVFETMDEVADRLQRLMDREEPLVASLARRPGQKGERFAQLLGGEVAMDEDVPALGLAPAGSAKQGLTEELDAIRARLESLEEAFEAFKRQFE